MRRTTHLKRGETFCIPARYATAVKVGRASGNVAELRLVPSSTKCPPWLIWRNRKLAQNPNQSRH